MHPDLYRANKVPAPLKADLPSGVPGVGWNKLEENSMGEFGWKEVLKQFLDGDRAKKVAVGWDGDDYATFEQKDSKRLMLFTRIRFNSEEMTANFFGAYAEALKKKYAERTHSSSAEQDLEFQTPDGGVFLRCTEKECATLEGGDATHFSQWIKKLGWPAPSAAPAKLTATGASL